MLERLSTVKEFLEGPLYDRAEMVGRLVRDSQTGKEYQLTHLTTKTARCDDLRDGSTSSFSARYVENFQVLNPEMYAEAQ
ncbi:hypothetical protein KAR91_03290 [Candidatus Pacearchaeota archaeon]|nr:hypothetical protein [Candidatus Pacearchaeota archaeon]